MPYTVLPFLVGTLIFSPALKAFAATENLEAHKFTDPEDLKKVHQYSDIFDDYQMGSTPYQPGEEVNQ